MPSSIEWSVHRAVLVDFLMVFVRSACIERPAGTIASRKGILMWAILFPVASSLTRMRMRESVMKSSERHCTPNFKGRSSFFVLSCRKGNRPIPNFSLRKSNCAETLRSGRLVLISSENDVRLA